MEEMERIPVEIQDMWDKAASHIDKDILNYLLKSASETKSENVVKRMKSFVNKNNLFKYGIYKK